MINTIEPHGSALITTALDQVEDQQLKSTTGISHRIAGDVVNKATAALPDEQRATIRRLHAYYIENSLSLNELAKQLEISPASLGLIFKGRYDAALDSMVKKINDFFALLDKRAKGRKLKFIPTSLSEKICGICDSALEFQKIAFLFGDSQVGKSESLLHYHEQNKDNVVYCTIPTGGNISNFLMQLGVIMRIGDNLSTTRLRERIKAAFDDRMLLIVDEAHRCIRTNSASIRAIETIEYVREIFDDSHCGVVICATNVFRDAMDNGPVHKILRQTRRRRLCTVQLPSRPSQGDLDTFAAAYKLKPATGEARTLEKEMIDNEGLGMWLTLLRMGAKMANERKLPHMDWSHVIAARAALKFLESDQN